MTNAIEDLIQFNSKTLNFYDELKQNYPTIKVHQRYLVFKFTFSFTTYIAVLLYIISIILLPHILLYCFILLVLYYYHIYCCIALYY